MNLRSFAFLPKHFIGVDIGTASIKVVEVSGWGGRRTLKNFGELSTSLVYDNPQQMVRKDLLVATPNEISRALRAVIQEAGITGRKAVFSIPDFSTFFTTFRLPFMTQRELPEAVRYEARRHVPIPLSEVMFDWQIVDKPEGQQGTYKVLIAAVPTEIIKQYESIAKMAKLRLLSLEAEVFGIIRSSVPEDDSVALVLDIGAQSSSISVVVKGTLYTSHSIEMGGHYFSRRIATSLGVEYAKAEQIKQREGMNTKAGNTQVLVPLVDQLIREAEKVAQGAASEGAIKKIYLAGGSAGAPGLREYFEEHFEQITGDSSSKQKHRVELVRPFQNLFYPPILEKALLHKGPSYATAVGAALRGFSL